MLAPLRGFGGCSQCRPGGTTPRTPRVALCLVEFVVGGLVLLGGGSVARGWPCPAALAAPAAAGSSQAGERGLTGGAEGGPRGGFVFHWRGRGGGGGVTLARGGE